MSPWHDHPYTTDNYVPGKAMILPLAHCFPLDETRCGWCQNTRYESSYCAPLKAMLERDENGHLLRCPECIEKAKEAKWNKSSK